MKPPKSIELDAKEMQDLKERVAAGALQEGDHKILEAVITTYLFFSKLLEAKNTSIICPSSTSLSLLRANSLNTWPRYWRSCPYKVFLRYLGIHVI